MTLSLSRFIIPSEVDAATLYYERVRVTRSILNEKLCFFLFGNATLDHGRGWKGNTT